MINTPLELKARFAYQFGDRHLGRTYFRGWFPVFADLCQQMDELLGDDKRGFAWLQLEEDCGTAHFNWQAPNCKAAELDARIGRLVRQVAHATESRCIVCGEPATLSEELGRALVLCERHARHRRLAGLGHWQYLELMALFPKEER